MNKPRSSAAGDKPVRNPLYVKIGKRIRQARSMARESNSRELSLRLGWSAGRIHNYETGLSTPGVEETLQFCDALGVDPAWLTYGSGAPRPAELHSARYRRLIDALAEAEKRGELPEMLDALKLTPARLKKLRANPFAKIPSALARRAEKHLGLPRGGLDHDPQAPPAAPTDEARELLALYDRLAPRDRQRLHAIGEILVR